MSLSLSVVCSQIEVSVTGRSLVERSSTEWGMQYVILKPQECGGSGLLWAVAQEKKEKLIKIVQARPFLRAKT